MPDKARVSLFSGREKDGEKRVRRSDSETDNILFLYVFFKNSIKKHKHIRFFTVCVTVQTQILEGEQF